MLILRDRVSEMFLKWYLGDRKRCPPLNSDNQFLSKSATELAALIRTGEITSTQLITATISRMNEVNGTLNAIVDGPFTEALKEAAAIDERIRNNDISKGEL